MARREYVTSFLAVAPIVQLSGSQEGEKGSIRTMHVIGKNGNTILTPNLSGNSFGGSSRAGLIGALYAAVGLTPNVLLDHPMARWYAPSDEKAGRVPPDVASQRKTYHTMYKGGLMEPRKDGVKIGYKEHQMLAKYLPAFTLLGGYYGGRQNAAKCAMEHAYPASTDIDHLFPNLPDDWFLNFRISECFSRDQAWSSWRIADDSIVPLPPEFDKKSSDDDKKEKKKKTVNGPSEKEKEEEEKTDGASANKWRTIGLKTDMVYAGTPFLWMFSISDAASELEASAMAYGIELLRARGRLGGMAKQGMGRVQWGDIVPAKGSDPLPSSSVYLDFVTRNADTIRAILLHNEGYMTAIFRDQPELI